MTEVNYFILIGHNSHTLAVQEGDNVWLQTYCEDKMSPVRPLGDMSLTEYWGGTYMDSVFELSEDEVSEWAEWRGDAQEYMLLKAQLREE